MDGTLSPEEQATFDNLYGTTPTAAEPTSAGVLEGAYRGFAGVPSGLSGAALSTASFLSDTSHVLGNEYADTIGLSPTERRPWDIAHQAIEQQRQSTAEFYRPDPQTTGFVGNTLFGAADVLTRVGAGNLLAPGAGLAIAAGTTGYERAADLEAQGIDPATAQLSGVLTGGSLVAMGGVSSFGSSTLTRVLSGAGSNVAFGAATRGLDSALLEANGYHAQAEQQKWSDGASILADAVIGGAFHLLPRAHTEATIPAEQVDADLTAKSAQNVSDLAPGVPTDPRSASAHVDALDTAQAQLMDGQPVAVDPVVRDAQFVPRPEEVTSSDPSGTFLLEEGTPPPEQGFTRLFRGEHANHDRGIFVTEDANDGKVGGWFTPDLNYAESYKDTQEQGRRGPDRAGRIVFVDVPTEKLKQYSIDGSELGKDVIRQGEDSYFIPSLRRENVIEPQTYRSAPDPLRNAMADAGVPAESLAEPVPTPDQALRQRLNGDPAQLFADYAALPDSKGGRVLNTDTARELSPEYLADRTRSADVHEPASAMVKALYAKKLSEPTPEGFNRSVLFTAGGTGAGKTTAVRGFDGFGNPPEIVYDTNMNTPASAEQKVQQALDAGRKVTIMYVYRDPVEALTHGALTRAERQAREFGSGRTVPLAEHAKTHTGVRPVMEALAEKYKNDPRVNIRAYDNSRGKDNGAFVDLANIPKVGQNGLHERLQAALHQEHQAGRISDATRAGFEAAGRDSPRVQRSPLQGAGRESSAQRPEGRSPAGLNPESSGASDTQAAGGASGADAGARPAERGTASANDQSQSATRLDPARDGEVERARQAVEQYPDEKLSDGTTAAEAMRAADEEVTQAVKTGEAVKAAIACFLRFGADV